MHGRVAALFAHSQTQVVGFLVCDPGHGGLAEHSQAHALFGLRTLGKLQTPTTGHSQRHVVGLIVFGPMQGVAGAGHSQLQLLAIFLI